MQKKTALIIGGIFAIVALITTGAAGAGTHWFGLASPHYSQQTITACNSEWGQVLADLASARGALQALDTVTARHWLAEARIARQEMTSRGCPDGPYPLRNHG